jgi:hypothetical protein
MPDEELKEKEEVTEETSEEDEFDQAFNEAIGDSDGEEKESEEEPADTGSSDEQEEEQGQEEVTETNENQEPDLLKKYEEALRNNQALEHKMRSWEGRISAANKKTEEAERKLQELTQAQAKSGTPLPDGAEDDDEVLKEFIEEFPALEKPIKALVKKMAASVVETKLKDIEPRLRQIDPIIQKSKDDVVREHFNILSEKHPDWKDLRDNGKLTAWIETQPMIVRQSLERVVKEGSTEEVIEMFDLYKGTSQKPSTQSRKTAPNTKAQNMMAVESSASGIPKGKAQQSPNDFDAAWEEALRD